MSEQLSSSHGPSSSRHRPHASLITSASGVADSTLSFNTYATGITDGSLCLSQFPPPPMTIPASPITERFLPSPARSTFTITAPASAHPMTDSAFPSPARSTFTVTAASLVSSVSRPPGSIDQPELVAEQGLPSPAQNTFTAPTPVVQPVPSAVIRKINDDSFPSDRTTEHLQHSDPQARSPTPTSILGAGKLSPYDWHEGSSIISMDPAEERMLSTSFITGLLSSTASTKARGDAVVPRGPRPLHHTDLGSFVSDMSYPPSSRYHEPVIGSTRFPPSSYPSTFPGERLDSRVNGENDTIISYDGYADIVQHGSTLTRKVSVVGMAPATLRRVSSTSSVPESLHPRSQATYNGTRPTDIQPLVNSPPPLTPATPLSSEFGGSSKLSAKRQRRVSAHSSKTVRSHVSSLISSAGQRTARVARATMEWMRIKPLPPVPTIPNISLYHEQEHRRIEGAVPLPELVERADRLTAMLDSGHLPHDSIGSFSKLGLEKDPPFEAHASGLKLSSRGRRRQSIAISGESELADLGSPLKSQTLFKRPLSRNGKIRLFVTASVLALLVLIAIVVGVTVGHKHTHGSSCPTNRTGDTCSLDSTCVCISSDTSQCNPLAQSLINLIPVVNGQFNVNFTPAAVANAMSSSQSLALSSDCAAQARVVDVSPALDSQSVPNRTEWAQSALLWSFVLSQNTSSVGKLRDFITTANWKHLSGDGPVTGESSGFSTTQLGYTFDFAAQTISEPGISFISDGQPSRSQLAEVSSTARTTLDRMYTFASASSTLRSTAMAHYWQSVLRQDPNNFHSFVSLLISSPILIPFDANWTTGSTSISSLLTNSTSVSFPPPLSCYPGLTQSQLQLITNLETYVFGLSSPTAQGDFNSSCYVDRPVYGVLDVLHLRLPFKDSRTGAAKQAAILSRDATSRVVVYNGEVLSSLPNLNLSSIPTTDPRRFGTLNHINHVLLDFFESIPDINVASQFVDYVLSSPVTPPSNDTLLGKSLDTIPTLEVAAFGSVTPPDIKGVVSSFTTPLGELFFGTDQSRAVRDWAIMATQTSVTWSEFANSPEIVNDNSLTDNAFNAVWNPAFLYFHSSSNATVNVGNITAGFAAVNKFTDT
ncbi:hypothetical protein B0F90DRAFT_1676445 [Multifurca ochricompacta]|uniref:Uncharacterized protein n=1 Tax=Multifurca ochricompacta TaxID=376703 RepID=A0AAD4QTR7_9AGAM|nr:hypothetical protein B0F90DRAFT_1676445 [Multifurca ochricompacta]